MKNAAPLLDPQHVSLDLTYRCNQNCPFCFMAGSPSGIKGLKLPRVSPAAQEFPLLTAAKAELERYLLDRKVPLECINEPLLPEHAESGFPAAGRYFREALHLPVYAGMLRTECLYITKAVKSFFAGKSGR